MEKLEEIPEGSKSGLCHRCEHRARFFETGHGSRYECSQPTMRVWSCYQYQPTQPCAVGRTPTENADWGKKRPVLGPAMFSARTCRVPAPPLVCVAMKLPHGATMPFWVAKKYYTLVKKLLGGQPIKWMR